MTDLDYILLFKKDYGDDVYNDIEKSSQIFNKKVKLKSNDLFIGTVVNLWLPSNIKYYRKSDLWLINWDNGNNGIVEEKDIIIIL
jgi:hypothetical protein